MKNAENTNGRPSGSGLLGVLGLCARARQLICGTPAVCEAVADGSAAIVIEAADTSDNTHKRLTDKCKFYHVDSVRIGESCETLAHAVGKTGSVAAVAVRHGQFATALRKQLDKCNEPEQKI